MQVSSSVRLVAYGRVLELREFVSRAGRHMRVLSLLVQEHVSVDGEISADPVRVYPLPIDLVLPDGVTEVYPVGSEVPVLVSLEPVVIDRYRRGFQPVLRLVR